MGQWSISSHYKKHITTNAKRPKSKIESSIELSILNDVGCTIINTNMVIKTIKQSNEKNGSQQ